MSPSIKQELAPQLSSRIPLRIFKIFACLERCSAEPDRCSRVELPDFVASGRTETLLMHSAAEIGLSMGLTVADSHC